jgi:hypothetical protein
VDDAPAGAVIGHDLNQQGLESPTRKNATRFPPKLARVSGLTATHDDRFVILGIFARQLLGG